MASLIYKSISLDIELKKQYQDIWKKSFSEKDHEPAGQRWKEETMRMSNIINELESRCKMLVAENQHLEAMVHKYRTEYDVDTAYLKNQVKNERDRQMQWKDLYFKAHAELMDLKRHTHNAPFQRNVNNNKSIEGEYGPAWQPRSRTRTESDCQECENERKRKASDSEASGRHPSSQNPYPHGQENRLVVSTHSVPAGPPPPPPPVKPGIHHSPVEKPPDEGLNRPPGIPMLNQPPQDVSRPPFPHMIPSQVYKPEMLQRDSQQPPNQYFKCNVCGIYYDTEEKLHFHMELHSDRYGGPGSMVNDMHEMTNLQSPFDYLICPECNQSFKTDDDYRRHLLVHVFKCRLCGQTLENEMSFLVHVKGHGENNSQPYHCFLCDKQFSHVSHLTRHVLSHPDEQPFECVECGKHFARKGHLTRHMTMHSKCRPYTCTDCGKTFAHRTHLRRHEIVHSGLRPHKCKVCQQSFSRKSSLSRHYFIHTTEKPFVCPICEKGFNRKGRLKNHLKIHIREGYPELVDYVIERRPITKEFIEKINMVKPDDGTLDSTDFISTTIPKTEASGAAPSFTSSGSFPTPEKPVAERELGAEIKEESDDSSSSESEGEIDEVEAELSEEITYYEPPKSSDLSMTSMVTMVPPRSKLSSKTVKLEETKSTSTVVTASSSPPLSPSTPLPPIASSSSMLPPESSSSLPSDIIPHHPAPDS